MTNPLYYDSTEVNNAIDSIYNIFDDLNLFVTIGGLQYFKIIKDYDQFLEYSYNTGRISFQTYSTIGNLFVPLNSTNLGLSCDIESDLNSIILDKLPGWQNSQISVFSTIYKHSQELWSEEIVSLKDTNDPLPCGMNPDQAMIAADALGGLVGLGLGSAGSLILGALASAAESEDQENHNSILVGSEYPESRWHKR